MRKKIKVEVKVLYKGIYKIKKCIDLVAKLFFNNKLYEYISSIQSNLFSYL